MEKETQILKTEIFPGAGPADVSAGSPQRNVGGLVQASLRATSLSFFTAV